ncbi:putative 3,4-dihydroxy-2-butanone kinase [Lathyrus oleraceus]|uniref:putative 3,4-dihydroxy-2-butanone kinase n=1 Tax=Pisum sativum TaxID=3888 RepID=UPI0021CF7CF1|nr:putative 3,4-dihydroxy-2-butanone kinase [Pisum sativum]
MPPHGAHRVNNIEGAEAEDLVVRVEDVQTSLLVVKGRLLSGGVYPGCDQGCVDCAEAENGCSQLRRVVSAPATSGTPVTISAPVTASTPTTIVAPVRRAVDSRAVPWKYDNAYRKNRKAESQVKPVNQAPVTIGVPVKTPVVASPVVDNEIGCSAMLAASTHVSWFVHCCKKVHLLQTDVAAGCGHGGRILLLSRLFFRQMEEHGLAVDRVYTGSFMTSLDMEGLSISIMRADRSILQRLDAETKAPYWPVGVSGNRLPAKIPVPIPRPRSAKIVEPQSQPLKLTEQRQLLELVIVAAATAPLNDAAETVGEIGSTIGKSMGGTSGTIYSILCKAACAQLKTSSHSVITSKQGVKALASAMDVVSKYGGAKVGYRTFLDALIPALSSLEKRLSSGDDPATAFLTSSQAALDGAESTKKMRAKAGRTLYVPREIQSSVPDPGAYATASWYKDSC